MIAKEKELALPSSMVCGWGEGQTRDGGGRGDKRAIMDLANLFFWVEGTSVGELDWPLASVSHF